MEFALVLPVLLLILFGIVDYGIYFSDSLASQSGVRDATRQAVTANFTPCDSGSTDVLLAHDGGVTPTTNMQSLACMVDSRTQAITGHVYVDVVLPQVAGAPTWEMGQPLLVCETLVASGLTGFVPLPSGSVRSKAVMTIEDPTDTTPEVGGQSSPANADSSFWSWCTL